MRRVHFTTVDVPGGIGTSLNGINNLGQLVGSYNDAAGALHGFIATPTPEPSSLVLLGSGLAWLE